tara:strand:- start:810 stop:1730 length:921 start_codon:yes stop_codon:yes gene_type:complete
MSYLLDEIPENFKAVCDYFENDKSKIYANLMPKCGTFYVRKTLRQTHPRVFDHPALADGWKKHAIDPWPLIRGDHYVCHDVGPDGIGLPRRGWFRNQVKIFGNSKFFWFTVVRNPFNILVSYFTFGWPYEKLENYRHYTSKVLMRPDAYRSFDTYVKTFCDPDSEWLIKESQNFLYFPIFDERGDCRCTTAFRLENIDFCLSELGKNFNFKYTPDTPTKSSRSDGNRDDWKNYYTEELYDLVSKKFEKECLAFGYDFDGVVKGDKRKIIDTSNIKYRHKDDELEVLEYDSKEVFNLLEKFHHVFQK